MAQTVLHTAASRGGADHGWLKASHTFSFAGYFNPERVQFGALRVLNDDTIDGGRGFGEHPHDNMEIITIPLKGSLKHKDSMGNEGIIVRGEVQAMSAGTGIYHSEYNADPKEKVEALQIWLFPNKRNVEPRYDQIKVGTPDTAHPLVQVISPDPDDAGIWIHQDAWFNMGKLEKDNTVEYKIHKNGNGAYIFVIAGEITVNGQALSTRDGYGIWDTEGFTIAGTTDADFLIMDVPMEL